MDTELQVIHTQTHDAKPLAILRNLPGCDAELTPDQMRSLADALNSAADECEKRPMGKRQFCRAERRYPMSEKTGKGWHENIRGPEYYK